MTLSKLEIQQMLREMNVKFDADESYDILKQRLQQANHTAWLKSGAGDPMALGGSRPPVVKKRKRSVAAPVPPPTTDDLSEPLAETPPAPEPSDLPASPRKSPSDFRPRPIEKPEPGKPWKSVSEGTEPFNRKKDVFALVLRRAGICCECCGQPEDKTDSASTLSFCYLDPPDPEGEHSIKNVAALCQTCGQALSDGTLPKTALKKLRRKTRTKLYHDPEVVKKSPVPKNTLSSR
ncbi:hypothetical protein LJC71_06975 [Desulfosarcina sp. OttesenSCG-928-A07]|nr:hypothetical protein [Desulfosarcina sp. OttesenSCG-928-G17]MDL2329467.1 hypothetical protein [Desulfosarcina sp. OttesenSCG-928-A07]